MRAVRLNGWFRLPEDFIGNYSSIFDTMGEYFFDNVIQEVSCDALDNGEITSDMSILDYEESLLNAFKLKAKEDKNFVGSLNLVDIPD